MLASSEAEVDTDHGFGGVGPAVGLAVDLGGCDQKVGSFVDVSAVLEAQAEMRQRCDIEASPVDIDAAGAGGCAAGSAARRPGFVC